MAEIAATLTCRHPLSGRGWLQPVCTAPAQNAEPFRAGTSVSSAAGRRLRRPAAQAGSGSTLRQVEFAGQRSAIGARVNARPQLTPTAPAHRGRADSACRTTGRRDPATRPADRDGPDQLSPWLCVECLAGGNLCTQHVASSAQPVAKLDRAQPHSPTGVGFSSPPSRNGFGRRSRIRRGHCRPKRLGYRPAGSGWARSAGTGSATARLGRARLPLGWDGLGYRSAGTGSATARLGRARLPPGWDRLGYPPAGASSATAATTALTSADHPSVTR